METFGRGLTVRYRFRKFGNVPGEAIGTYGACSNIEAKVLRI